MYKKYKYLDFYFRRANKFRIAPEEMDKAAADFVKQNTEEYVSEGGRVGYAIGSPEKQIEAGAPPILNEGNIDILKDKLSCILYTIDKYKQKNDPQLLTFVSLLIEIFYNELSIRNKNNLNLYFLNKMKLVRQINNARKFNLDKKNLFISLRDTLENESK